MSTVAPTYPIFEAERARLARRGDAALGDFATPPAAGAAGSSLASMADQHAAISISAAGTHVLIAGAAGQKIQIMEIMIYTDTNMDLELFNGSVSLTGLLKSWPAQQGFFFPDTSKPHFELTSGSSFILTAGAAGQIGGFIRYRQV